MSAVMAPPGEPAGTVANPLSTLTSPPKLLLPNQPATTLKTSTFEWTMSDQYDEFKLFLDSMESWFHLQANQMNLMTKVPSWSVN